MQALLTFVYFLEKLQGLLVGAMWGFRRRRPDRGSRLSSAEGLNSKFERSNGESHLRGSWINESGVEGQGVGWMWSWES